VNAALVDLQADLDAYYREVPNYPEKYGIPEADARDFRDGIANSLKENRPKSQRVMQLEHEMLGLMEEVVSFVEARPIPVEVDGGSLLFAYDYEIDEYNRLVDEINVRVSEQTNLQAAILKSMREKAQRFKEDLQ
jgi:hypothetical protein